MQQQNIEILIPLVSRYVHKRAIGSLRQAMQNADDASCVQIANIPYKNPMVVLMCSIFLGHFGIDRFLMADTSVGIVKILCWVIAVTLFTVGSAILNLFCLIVGSILMLFVFVWWIVDIATLYHTAYVWNYYRILDVCKITFFGEVKISNPYIVEGASTPKQLN